MCKSSLAKDDVVKGDWNGVNDHEFSNYTFQNIVARLSLYQLLIITLIRLACLTGAVVV